MSPKPLMLVVGLALTSATSMSVSAGGAIADGLFSAAAAGAVPVIIELNVDVAPEATLAAASGEAAVDSQRAAIAEAQQAVLRTLALPDGPAAEANGVKLFQFVPMMALRADSAMLETLKASPQVKSVVADELSAPIEEPSPSLAPAGSTAAPLPSAPLLTSSIVVIGSNVANSGGIGGYGATVAVLDTGVQKTHPFLSGQVVSEACYSTTSGSASTSVCPGGVGSSTAAGSGVNCNVSVSGCNHGTHVAGIVAGKTGVTGAPTSGVAPGASVIAVQVFSQFPASSCSSGTTCVLSYTSDQIRGLERIFALRNTYNIAAINMSLGGGSSTTACDSDSRKAIIDQLRAAGIATAIAAGNDGFRDRVSFPGCISSAVTVGATDDSDNVASFSNIDDTVDFLAPGVSVVSSIPTSTGSGFASFNGTSMATPHVAGVFALFKQLDPLASVSEIENRLASLSVQVDDNRSSGVQDAMDRVAVAWMGNNRCFVTGKLRNNWAYTSSTPFSYVSVSPTSDNGANHVYYARIPNGTSLARMLTGATGGQHKDPSATPTVTIRGTGPCPTSGTTRYIYTGDYGFMTTSR